MGLFKGKGLFDVSGILFRPSGQAGPADENKEELNPDKGFNPFFFAQGFSTGAYG
jgi:hypothetical protein